MKKIFEFLFKIFIFWAFIYFTQNGYYEGELGFLIYIFWRFIIFCLLFYGLFLHDIIKKIHLRFKEEEKEIEEFAFREELKEKRKKQRKEKKVIE